MKKLLLLSLVIFFSATKAFPSDGIGAYLSHSVFNVPGEEPYIEMHLEIIGKTLKYVQKPSGLYQGSVQVTMIIKQDTGIKDFRKYELLSAEISDTTDVNVNFIDLQRFPLPNGNYTLELAISDMNVDKEPEKLIYPFDLEFPSDKMSVSSVQLVNSFTKTTEPNSLSKSGYDLVPLVDNFFPSDKNKIILYTEIYNPLHTEGSEEKYLISYYLETHENNNVLNDFARTRREVSKPVYVVMHEFDINRLPSGNYNVVVSVRDKDNKEVAVSSSFIQRSNPKMDAVALDFSNVDVTSEFVLNITNADSLREFIRSLTPISTDIEKIFIRHQLATAPLNIMQQYFQRFWEQRDPNDPANAWLTYKIQVDRVHKAYGTQVRKGYDTDMGRVYLAYGEPSTIQDVPFETSNISGDGTVPYQIWLYYSLNQGRERNKRFVFINSEVGARDYSLVHSDAIGEIQNYGWQNLLIRDPYKSYSRDEMIRDRSRSGTIYNNPF